MIGLILFVEPDKPWSTWEGFKTYIKENPGELTLGTTRDHMMKLRYIFEQEPSLTDEMVNMVLYPSSAPALADFLGGHIDLGVQVVGTAMTLVPESCVALLYFSGQKLSAEEREKDLMGVPDYDDFGYKQLITPKWCAVHPDTPDEIVQVISEKMGSLLKHKSVTRLIGKMKEEIIFIPYPEAQEAYDKMLKAMRRAIKLLEK